MVELSPGSVVRVVAPSPVVAYSSPGIVQNLWLKEGPAGGPGRSVVSIARTSGTGAPGTTDTYMITYSDATTSTFTVYNGSNGTGTGDVVGPASSTDLRIAVFSGTTGKLLSVGNNTIGGVLSRANHTGTQAASTITGLGDAAAKNTGTTTGTLAAGDDSRITGAAQKSSNLSDLASASTARTNLGLGTAATVNTGTTSGTVPLLGASGTLAVARLATGTPDGTKFVRDDGTLAVPSGGGGSGGLLAYVERTAATISTYTIASSANADVDATNLAITFTAPASGQVLVRLAGAVGLVAPGGSAARCYWSLRTSTTNAAGSERLMQTAAAATTTPTLHLSTGIRLTGLTPGNSYTYKWAWRTGGTATLYYGNGTSTAAEFGTAMTNNGALTIEAWSA